MNNSNLELPKEVQTAVAERYAKVVAERPFFCDMLFWMGRDNKADEKIAKQRMEALVWARRTFADRARTRHLTSLNVLDVVLKDLWMAMVDAHIIQKACSPKDGDDEAARRGKEEQAAKAWDAVCDKTLDGIAVLLRILDVVRNRQTIG